MTSQKRRPDFWVIVDNSSCPAEDWSIAEDAPLNIHYQRVHEPRPIGWLRNRCIEIALEKGAEYIVFWDDDDYYPPTRISAGVEALEKNPDADISGSSKMYLLLTRENVLMTTGPFHDKHATAATWTVRRRCAETRRFDETKDKGEEVTFTDGWKVNLVQTSPEDMIVVMGHGRNTVDKSDLMKRPHVYNAQFVNQANGKMAARIRWPTLPWDLFRSTFSV